MRNLIDPLIGEIDQADCGIGRQRWAWWTRLLVRRAAGRPEAGAVPPSHGPHS